MMKPGRETIYTRVPREWRYKAGAAIATAFFRGGEITFSWTYKALAAFGSQMVFGVGLLFASVMTLSAWRLLRAERKLPSERAHAPAWAARADAGPHPAAAAGWCAAPGRDLSTGARQTL